LQDRVMLRKRAVIESVNDELKNICQIEHTRHRSFTNFITNLVAGLLAYNFLPKKPSIRVDFVDDKQLMLFKKSYRTHVNLMMNSNLLELYRSKYSIVIGEESKVRFICRL